MRCKKLHVCLYSHLKIIASLLSFSRLLWRKIYHTLTWISVQHSKLLCNFVLWWQFSKRNISHGQFTDSGNSPNRIISLIRWAYMYYLNFSTLVPHSRYPPPFNIESSCSFHLFASLSHIPWYDMIFNNIS